MPSRSFNRVMGLSRRARILLVVAVALATVYLVAWQGQSSFKRVYHWLNAQQLPHDPLKSLESATSLQTYLLDSDWATSSTGGFKDEIGLHAHEILGERTIDDPQEIERLVAGIKAGVHQGGMPSACFNPRHAVSVSNANGTYDFLICFECAWLYVYRRGEKQPLAALTFARGKDAIIELFPEDTAEPTISTL